MKHPVTDLREYLVKLPAGKMVLWCYLIWYLATVSRYFDPTLTIWLNSLGISVVVGTALLLSVSASVADAKPRENWQTFRLFFMPFAVSSFSSLIKGRGFILILPPSAAEIALSVGCCAAFVFAVLAIKRFGRSLT